MREPRFYLSRGEQSFSNGKVVEVGDRVIMARPIDTPHSELILGMRGVVDIVGDESLRNVGVLFPHYDKGHGFSGKGSVRVNDCRGRWCRPEELDYDDSVTLTRDDARCAADVIRVLLQAFKENKRIGEYHIDEEWLCEARRLVEVLVGS